MDENACVWWKLIFTMSHMHEQIMFVKRGVILDEKGKDTSTLVVTRLFYT